MITSQVITSFSQKIIQSLNVDASVLIEEAKEKAKKAPQGSVQQRICVEELDLIRLFQTGRQTNARSLLYLSTSNVQCRISNDDFQLYFNQAFRQPIPGLKHIEFCPFCEKKTRRFSLKEVYICLVGVQILHAMLLLTGLFRFFGILHDMLNWWIRLVNGCTIAILLVTENS